MPDGYNGAYTGQQIDAAIAKANAALPAPDSGTNGQILEKTESGTKWSDKPVMYVHVTENSGTYSADKTYEEIKTAYERRYVVLCELVTYGILQLLGVSSNVAIFVSFYNSVDDIIEYDSVMITSDEVIVDLSNPVTAANILFSRKQTGLTANNVQDVIKELAGKFPKPAAATLAASGWSSNTQTITVSGVKTSGQNVRLSPVTKADADAWASAGCWCTAQAENALTFTCDTVPAQDIQLNVEMQEVQS